MEVLQFPARQSSACHCHRTVDAEIIGEFRGSIPALLIV